MSFALDFIKVFIWILCSMAPWLLAGLAVSGIMSLFFTPERVRKHLGGAGFMPVLKAVLAGIPLPLCSCGVLPVAASLKKEGAGSGAVAAFYVSTPQIGVNSMILTFSVMGWAMGLVRIAAAFVTGMTCGLLAGKMTKTESSPSFMKREQECSCCCHECSRTKKTSGSPLFRAMDYGFNRMVAEVAPSMMAGLLIAALIQLLLPDDLGVSFFKGHAFLEFAALVLIAIPLYVCSSSAVPIAAALVMKGISPGAALVFMLAAPASNAVMIASMIKVLGGKATVIYIVVLAFVSIAAGVLLNLSGLPFNIAGQECCGVMCISVTGQICGAIFIALMLRCLIAGWLERRRSFLKRG